jgi:hypothetical protein
MAFCCWLALCRAEAQPAGDFVSARSASDQFLAVTPRQAGLPAANPPPSLVPGELLFNSTTLANPRAKISLDPNLLVISCERIKEALVMTLGRRDPWRGRITLFINPALPEEQSPILQGIYNPRGWNYQLTLPSPIEPRLLFRAIVKALLMETANRRAGAQSADVPLWLVAGLSAHLQADNLPILLLRPQSHLDTNQVRKPGVDPLRDQLRAQAPLSFQELCWPEAEGLTGRNYERYAACAQLFVEELLRFKDGSRCLDAMIDKLPQYQNWQTAFLQAFSPHFNRLLDVEKWWGLACVRFTGVDFASRFSAADSWHKLQHALDVPVEVHLRPDQLPAQAEINLQEIINTWEPAQAAAALQHVGESLMVLRLQITPELGPLLDRYLAIVQSYLNDTRPNRPSWVAKNHQALLAAARYAACKQLNALDLQRDALRPRYVSQPAPAQLSASAATSPPINSAAPSGR